MEAKDFLKQIEDGELRHFYYAYGDAFRVNDALIRFKARFLDNPDFEIKNLSDVELPEVISSLSTIGMFSSARAIVLKCDKKLTSEDQKVLLPWIETGNQNDGACLFVIGDDPDKRMSFFKIIDKKGLSVNFPKTTDKDVREWVKYFAKKADKTIDGEAIEELLSFVDLDLFKIKNEVDKLALYVGDEKKISVDSVSDLVVKSKSANVFSLSDLMVAKKHSETLLVLNELLESGTEAYQLIGLLAEHFRKILLVRIALSSGQNARSISLPGIPPFFMQKYVEQANKFKLASLVKICKILLETDHALKSKRINPRDMLFTAVLDVSRV